MAIEHRFQEYFAAWAIALSPDGRRTEAQGEQRGKECQRPYGDQVCPNHYRMRSRGRHNGAYNNMIELQTQQ